MQLTAAQNGLDPLTHYWYEVGPHDLRRICDDRPWVERLRFELTPDIECPDCRAIHWDDLTNGQAVTKLTYNLTGAFAHCPQDVLFVPDHGLEAKGNDMMFIVPMVTFGQFYAAQDDDRQQLAIVSKFADDKCRERARRRNPQPGRRGWAPPPQQLEGLVLKAVRRNDLYCLERDIEEFLRPLEGEQEDALKALADCIITTWRDDGLHVHRARSARVDVGEEDHALTIKTDPAVHMETLVGDLVVKMWLGPDEIPEQLTEFCHYAMRKAKQERYVWGSAVPGLWDVPRCRMRLATRPLPDDIDERVAVVAAKFRTIYDALPQQPRLPGINGEGR